MAPAKVDKDAGTGRFVPKKDLTTRPKETYAETTKPKKK